MRKLIAVLTLLVAFSINAQAQEKKAEGQAQTTAAELGKKQAAELGTFLGLDKGQTEDFARLFEQKVKTLDNANLTQERKDEWSRVIEAKIRATLNDKQMQKLESNAELFKRLTH